MKTRIAVVLMAALLALYLVFALRYGLLLIGLGEPIGIALGVALFVLPLLAIWALVAELLFAVRAERLGLRLGAEGGLPAEELPVLPSGRIDRAAAAEVFPRYKAETEAAPEEWRTYDEFAAGIDTYRLPNTDLTGEVLEIALDGGPALRLAFQDAGTVSWSADGALATAGDTVDPYDAVAVRDDVIYLNIPFESRAREALTLVYSTTTRRVVGVHSVIQAEHVDGVPQVTQEFWAGTLGGGTATGEAPAASRDLIGKRNVYRYSPEHLYEHVYMSTERYMWQCIQGVQRGHGDVDLSTVWKFDDGLYLFCFREFKIAVASVWLHDLGYQLHTTGIFLGLNGDGESEHSRAGGHIYPLGSVEYPDIQPI